MKKNIFTALVCALTLCIVLAGCGNVVQKPDRSAGGKDAGGNGGNSGGGAPPPATAGENKLLVFAFERKNNGGKPGKLGADQYLGYTERVDGLRGKIDEAAKTVTLILPYDVYERTFTASFRVSEGASVFVGSTEQKSGMTENDFTNPVVYTVKAADGSAASYTVKLEEFVPEGDIEGKAFDDLSAEEQKEVKTFYGSYWPGTYRDNCIEISDDGLTYYGFMSVSYENVRWSKVSSSMWVCCSYVSDDDTYERNDRRVVLRLTKNGETVELLSYVTLMSRHGGPFQKGKAPEKFEENGETFYAYDAEAAKKPTLRMKVPTPK